MGGAVAAGYGALLTRRGFGGSSSCGGRSASALVLCLRRRRQSVAGGEDMMERILKNQDDLFKSHRELPAISGKSRRCLEFSWLVSRSQRFP